MKTKTLEKQLFEIEKKAADLRTKIEAEKSKNKPKEITDIVKTFNDATKICKPTKDQLTLSKYNGEDKDMNAVKAFLQLTIIAKALNESWKPNWNDSNEAKHYPYFDMRSSSSAPAGVGFSGTNYRYSHDFTGVGSRLCFKTRALAEYAGKQFLEIYREYMAL